MDFSKLIASASLDKDELIGFGDQKVKGHSMTKDPAGRDIALTELRQSSILCVLIFSFNC